MVVMTSRAAHAAPAGTDDVVDDDVDELPVDGGAPVVEVVADGDEHAANATATTATAPRTGPRRIGAPRLLHRADRCDAVGVRS
jgi:hypothetical protein